MIEFSPGRRRFLTTISRDLPLAALSAYILSGCEIGETTRKWERGEGPEAGDVIFVGDQPYLLRNGQKYPIGDIDRFVEYTKFAKYGGRVFREGKTLDDIPAGFVPDGKYFFDPYTGLPKANKPFGGEMNLYVAGFLTSGGDVFDVQRPEQDTFGRITSRQRSNNWDPGLDSGHFPYGEKSIDKGFTEYTVEDTMRNPEENAQHGLEFFETFKREMPLVQYNLIAHSLGGLFALAIAAKHYDAINNVILINSPIRGFSGSDDCQKAGTWVLKQGLRLYKRQDEKVTDYLFSLWNNKVYQREIEDFAAFFRSLGKRLIIVHTQDDRIAPIESTTIENAELVLLKGSLSEDCPVTRFPPKADIPAIRQALKAHGAPLENDTVIDKIKDAVGRNLAQAA